MKKIQIIKKKAAISITAVLTGAALLLCPAAGYSQSSIDDDLDLPCGGEDPYATECPVDTWTYVLVIAGISFGTYSIHHANKTSER
ncbi:hypothetical protein FPZ43_12275 [Mucilaginibacter pallidiroseus]|uniref:Uncharacterized protein n=1 Tax=Mucilaginibacter pallidiroseus TaxID=2599295 RepID=A0A563UCI0_9SPHI|nr:hypothetical protein [Mucilaginibacter pallidiroseus]TWR29030.1 hypothetical protein FPZ43_12275 [Mucilaginibacter pallidiroseus]